MDSIYKKIKAADDIEATDDVIAGDDLTVADDATITGDLNVVGAFNHDGSTFGALGAAPAAQGSAYTQTYSTAARVNSAALTHAVGTADGTVDDVGGAFNQTTLNDNFKELTTEILVLKKLINALIDDLQSFGFAG